MLLLLLLFFFFFFFFSFYTIHRYLPASRNDSMGLNEESRQYTNTSVKCAILAIFDASTSDVDLRKRIVSLAKRLRHRGPDASGGNDTKRSHAHERLSIIDPESGSQPLLSPLLGMMLYWLSTRKFTHIKS